MKTKRILLLIKGLGRGGAEQLLVSAIPYMDRSRFDYEVAYLLPHKDALVGEIAAAGIEVRCLDGARGAGWIHRLRRLVAEREIDLVHVHSPYAAVGARIGLARRPPPLVATEHIGWSHHRSSMYWGNLLTFPRNDHVFCVSEHVRKTVRYPAAVRWLRMPPVETLYHGLDQAAVPTWSPTNGLRASLGIADGAPVVGTVANFKGQKGYPYLLEAAARVRTTFPEVRFVLVGTGPLEAEVRRRAAELGLDETVVFAGFRDDAPRVSATFDVFTLSSLDEGLSIALLEAMAQGRPSVVTEVGGLPELVEHGKQGLLVPPRDPAALAGAIVTLLGDPAARQRLGDAARARAARFDISLAMHRMEEVYAELLQ